MHSETRIWHIGAALLFMSMALTGLHHALIASALGAIFYALLMDRRVLFRVGRWKFWALMISVTLLAGLLLGANPVRWHGILVSTDGLIAGVMMSLRAVTFVISGVLLARSVSRERLLEVSTRMGMKHVSGAFEEAVDTLPRVQRTWKMLRKRADVSMLDSLALMLVRMADVAEGWSSGRVFGITGGRGAGKTTLLSQLANEAEKAGFRTSGIRQRRILSEDGATIAYDVCRWPNDDGLRIAEGTPGQGFDFSQVAFESAAEWLEQDTSNSDLLIIDELGMLESHGVGHSLAVRSILRNKPDLVLVATLRKDRLDALTEMFGIGVDRLIDLDAESADVTGFTGKVMASIREKQAGNGAEEQ